MKKVILYKTVILSVFSLIFFPCLGQEETVTITGKIVEEESNIAVSYASLHIKSHAIGTISDSLGRYRLEFSKAFINDTIIFSSIGYKRKTEAIKDLLKGDVTVELEDSLFMLDEVTALCYNCVEVHQWSSENKKKVKLMLSFATQNIDNAANFVKVIKEFHGKPNDRNNVLHWKKIKMKEIDGNKVDLYLATYSCSYCPLENEILVSLNIKGKSGENLLENLEYKEKLVTYFQEMLDLSFEQGADFSQLTEKYGRTFLKDEEVTYTGKAFSYYDKGVKGKIGEFRDGIPVGVWVWWYKDGTKGKEVGYDEGKMTGTCTWWFPNGQIKRQTEYKDDKKDGFTIMYYENGNKKFEGNFKNDSMEGKVTWWYDTGEIQKESLYEGGVFKGKTEWDRKGNIIEKTYLN